MTSPRVQSTRPAAAPARPVRSAAGAQPADNPPVPPMYWRVLRLSAVRPNGWQRATLVEGMIGVSIVLALADVASAWTIVVLPLVAMAIVKAHDYLAGLLDPGRRQEPPPARAADYATFAGIPVAILLLRLVTHPSGDEGTVSAVLLGLLAAVGLTVAGFRYRRRSGPTAPK